MPSHPSFQECRSYVASHLHSRALGLPEKVKPLPAITISRQSGARAHNIAITLQSALRAYAPKDTVPWTLFDENLVKKILEDHHLPDDLEKFMPDDAVSEFEGAVNELLGRHPSLWTLFEKTVSTIARLSHIGHSIIVGRGGNEITRCFSNVLNVRLIGSEAQRIGYVMKMRDMTVSEAKKYVKSEDAARRRFLKQHFHSDIDDPLRYDLVINTDRLKDSAVVEMLVDAIRSKN